MIQKTTFYRSNLPHWTPEGKAIFVTCRLKGSLPEAVIEDFKLKKQTEAKADKNFYNFRDFDDYLDKVKDGPTWFKDDKVAQIWHDALLFFDTQKYDLVCSTIMSNHVHFIIDNLRAEFKGTMMSLKSFSGKNGNKHLGRSGAFWQGESYDHWIRNDNEMTRLVRYTLNNPVKAGLVENWQDYKFNYLSEKYRMYL